MQGLEFYGPKRADSGTGREDRGSEAAASEAFDFSGDDGGVGCVGGGIGGFEGRGFSITKVYRARHASQYSKRQIKFVLKVKV